MAEEASFCHVFLSFKGETRNNFTCFLYAALIAEGFIPFMDESDIHVGNELDIAIQEGIRKSMSAIIIFSQNFADSTWCLDELVLILARNKSSRYFIIPIFYEVDIRDIKHQLGNYGIALEKHRASHNDKVDKWREALVKVGNICGEHVDGLQSTFIQKTVELFRQTLAAKFPEYRHPTATSSVLQGTSSSSSLRHESYDDRMIVDGNVVYEERNCTNEPKYLRELKMVMVKLSNYLVGFLNIITFFLSIPILIAGVWLSIQGTTECEHFLQKPVIAIGVFLMVISISGLIGVCCRVNWIFCMHLLVMFVLIVLIVLLLCFTIFAFVVTNKGSGEHLSEEGYKKCKLGDCSDWLQKKVNDNKNWRKIKSCLQYRKVCESMSDDDTNTPVDKFYWEHLTPIQSGCCKPSDSCNFTYVSPTNWTKMTEASPNTDCALWDNDPSILCFNCQSCKTGILDNIKSSWKTIAVVNVISLVCLIVVFSIGCCAFRNNRVDTTLGTDTLHELSMSFSLPRTSTVVAY